MFYQTYKTTLKNISRSKTFWLAVMMLFIIVIHHSNARYNAQRNYSYGGARLALDFRDTMQSVANDSYYPLLFAMPLVSVIATVMVLNRDYGDSFFEIEKSRGVKTYKYLTGRLAGLITVNFSVYALAVFTKFYWYIFLYRGANGMGTAEMLVDTIVRLVRDIVLAGFPCILFYICFTYAMGSIFKNAVMGAAAGIGYIVAFYAAYMNLRLRVNPFYFDYLSPVPDKLRDYWHFYDTEWFEWTIDYLGTSLAKAMACIGVFVGVSLIYCVIAYVRTHKREI